MKKALLTVVVFAAALAVVCAAGFAAAPGSGVRVIAADSPCPATGCASGACHGFDAVPDPDGSTEMTCPETGCSSAECHAWGALTGRYHQASDASLNLWILMPVALGLGLRAVVRALSKGGRRAEA